MFNKNKRKFYEDKELIDLDDFTDLMIKLFSARYNIGEWGRRSIEQSCDEIYDSVPFGYLR